MNSIKSITDVAELERFASDRSLLSAQRPSPPPSLPRPGHRATIDQVPLSFADAFALPREGTYACRKCSTSIPMPGVCAKCFAAVEREEREERLREVVGSIPRRFRDARFDDPRVREFIKDGRAVRRARSIDPLVDTVIISTDKDDTVKAGQGKTTLAVCILNALLDRALADAALFEQCRYARFIPAMHLTPPEDGDDEGKARHIRAITDAKKARVVILDDVGQDLLGAPALSALASQRRRSIVEIVQERHNAGLGMIMTTAIVDLAHFDEHYNGGGIGRRIHKDGGAGATKSIVVRSGELLAKLDAAKGKSEGKEGRGR